MNMDEEVRNTFVNNCVHAIIVLSQNRSTIKKADLYRLVFTNTSAVSIRPAVINAANSHLYKIFGMRLFEVYTEHKYILVNSHTRFSEFAHHPDSMCQELTVLYFTLVDIFASSEDNKSEDDLIESLHLSLEIPEETVKGYLESFLRKNYLQMKREQDKKLYSWGHRAVAEVEPESFFRQFLRLIGAETEKDWPDLRVKIDDLKRKASR